MEFIKRMKKREFIEIGLKTLASVLAAFVAIILMEGMIYGILLNAYVTNGTKSQSYKITDVDTTNYAYCVQKEDDGYYILYHTVGSLNDFWTCDSKLYTREQCENVKSENTVVYYNAPNAFEFSIEPYHYAIMIVLEGVVIGYFVYRFIKLGKTYKKIEKQFEETGTIEITNQ